MHVFPFKIIAQLNQNVLWINPRNKNWLKSLLIQLFFFLLINISKKSDYSFFFLLFFLQDYIKRFVCQMVHKTLILIKIYLIFFLTHWVLFIVYNINMTSKLIHVIYIILWRLDRISNVRFQRTWISFNIWQNPISKIAIYLFKKNTEHIKYNLRRCQIKQEFLTGIKKRLLFVLPIYRLVY